MFTKVSAHVPLLNTAEFPAYLPAKDPPPQLYPWKFTLSWRKSTPQNQGVPDKIPGKIVKESAYELSKSVEKEYYCACPKTKPPPKSWQATANFIDIIFFSKVVKGFVARWVIDDIGDSIDMRQFDNVAGVSTNQYLVNLIHYLFKGAEVSHNIGTIVLTSQKPSTYSWSHHPYRQDHSNGCG